MRHIERRQEKEDILSFVVKARDPVTGTALDFEELQLNAQTLL
jgi:cytochrome P450